MTRPPSTAGAAAPTLRRSDDDPDELLGLAEAARRIRVTPPTVRYWLLRGYINDYGWRRAGSVRERLVSFAEVQAHRDRPKRPTGGGVPDDLISLTEAARRHRCSVTRIRGDIRNGRFNSYGKAGDHPNATVFVSLGEVDDAEAWRRRSLSEAEAARQLNCEERTLRLIADRDGIEVRTYGGRREYERTAVRRCVHRRARMLTMRQTCERFSISFELLAAFIAESALETHPGHHHSRLVDPRDLAPLLKPKVCRVCHMPAPPGQHLHSACSKRTKEFRRAHSQRLSSAWQRPEAEARRERRIELVCPNCGRGFTRPAAAVRAARPTQDQFFCGRSCVAEYRFHKATTRSGGMENFARSHPSARVRQRLLGRAGGVKGAAAGIDAGRAKGGRPPNATPAQQRWMLALDRAGWSTRAIAEEVFGDARFKNRVWRFLQH
jgi:hypothetical protein